MGFSVSGATAIVFVGLLVSASTLLPALDRADERRSEAVDRADERRLDRLNTDIVVASATYNTTNETLVVAVDNSGATTLSADATDLLVDGSYETNPARTVDGEQRDVWASGERLRLTADTTTEPARVKVVSEHGVAATADVKVVS